MLPVIKDIKFSKFDETQQTDARLGLNHDKPSSSHKEEKREEDNQNDVFESVKENFSVQSLIIYLENYIEDHLLEEGEEKVQEPSEFTQKQEKLSGWYNPDHNNSSSAERKKAVLAYARTARAAQKDRYFSGTQTDKNFDRSRNTYSLNEIYRLLWDLRGLNEKGVKRLKINTNETLIVAIENAIKTAGDFL
ncbi:MAG: hypothetical protein OEY94_02440 [Alphaproteobacteria bacterium]|nr:hypothetical protein [Alphaproteobacteria bacterium]